MSGLEAAIVGACCATTAFAINPDWPIWRSWLVALPLIVAIMIAAHA